MYYIIQKVNYNMHILFSNPEAYDQCTIKYERYIPETMIWIKIYLASLTKPQIKYKRTIWSSTRLKLETDFVYFINNTLFDL